ncbi:hypothetical protein GCM10007866_16280 [Gluconobacter albidus]|uniref:HTH cro/C1-type domain-containing protein n=1 Tax=Gluconobacter albidus TaxID=318683 RepID=A0ABQ5X087_9PROT|nr:hypothetical protein AA3250_1954 [Gluconobacter albidus NBRC 3250]GLQ69177.1 hypothetical protein GCM10007866_16280 [Gluconobacter albidus]
MTKIPTPTEIEAAAKSSGRSMRDVCTNAGVAVSTWTRWKRGTTSPRIDVVERIAAAALPTRAKRKEVA